MSQIDKSKKFILTIPDHMYNKLQIIAARENTTITDVLQRFVCLGIMASYLEDDPQAKLIVKREGNEQQVLLI